MMRFASTSPEQTVEIGRRLGAVLRDGAVVSLEGPLGAGKTTLVKGLANALGIDEPVTSPTFTLVSSYQGLRTLHHVDLYRLDSIAEIADLGIEELCGGDAITVVEWGEKARPFLPADAVTVRLQIEGPGRLVSVEGAEL